jgi:hypothetical protein
VGVRGAGFRGLDHPPVRVVSESHVSELVVGADHPRLVVGCVCFEPVRRFIDVPGRG